MSAAHDTVDGTGRRHRVVLIGSGFGGLTATKALKNAPVDITMIARTQHQLFQPLLYQVATGILSEGENAPSTRRIFATSKTPNCCWAMSWRSTWRDAT
jgi:NADH:ubiquinone reductase (H+-translocating)